MVKDEDIPFFDEDEDDTAVTRTVVERMTALVQRQAEELRKEFNSLENQIAIAGRTLDELTTAHEIVDEALRGTEELRSRVNSGKKLPPPPRRLRTTERGH